MAGILNQIEITDSIVFSPDYRTNAYYISSPLTSLSGGTSLSLILPSTQGTEGQVLTRSGAGTMWSTLPVSSGGSSFTVTLPSTQGTEGQVLTRSGAGTTWTTPSSSSGGSSNGRVVFSTSFIQSTESSNEYMQLSGAGGVDDVICRFIYQGSSVTSISNVSCILASGSSSPTGTIYLKNGTTTIASMSFAGITSTPTIYSMSSISNLPSSPSILSFVINITGSSSQKVNVYSLHIY